MSTTDRQTESPAERPARLAVWAAAVTAAVAAGAAMLAAPGTAAPTVMGWSLHTKGQLVAPQLDDPGSSNGTRAGREAGHLGIERSTGPAHRTTFTRS